MLLYPRLPHYAAAVLAKNSATKSLDELYRRSSVSHSAALYAPTGGSRVDADRLYNLQIKIRSCAKVWGYPNQLDISSRQNFDTECAVILHENLALAPSEASNIGVWAFMTCIMLPDIVRWRFPGDQKNTSIDRFIGSSHGMRRNTFGRLWWRVYLLRYPQNCDPYFLLKQLTEDEFVQITERPSLVGNPLLARQLGISFLETVEHFPMLSRRELIRDAVKRVRRRLPILAFDVFDEIELKEVVDDIFYEASRLLVTNASRL